MSNLLIVESPNKIKAIQSYLGSDWVVKASSGHIRDLPIKEMGVSFPDYRPTYVPNAKGSKKISELKKLARVADQVYLATDPDREGEAIAWHLREALGLKKYRRISYTEVNKSALLKAIQSASDIDFNLVKAQEARRVLDRLVGYSVTPVISNKYGIWITAGRVQSVAVRIVVDREIAIKDFKPEDYFVVVLDFKTDKVDWKAKWIFESYLDGSDTRIKDESLANEIASIRDVKILSCETKKQFRRPFAPFITSTLQQAASIELKISPSKCMEVAQSLFDGAKQGDGLITYHRTDNPNISDDGFNAVIQWLDENGFAQDRVEIKNNWKAKKGAQEGHEGIRPVDVNLTPDELSKTKSLSNDEANLYRLIWNRTVASQMKSAEYNKTDVLLSAIDQVQSKHPKFLAEGRELLYSGWLKLLGEPLLETNDNESNGADQTLPTLSEGESHRAIDGKALAKLTKAPGRYTEASLVKKLEDEGIGRPSTYASILSNIVKREYIKISKRKLEACEHGFTIHKLLTGNFEFMELAYTRGIEEQLDDMAHGKKQYREVMDLVYKQLLNELEQIKDVEIAGVETHPCPDCGSPLRLIKNKFWGCSKHPECKFTANNVRGKPVKNEPKSKTDLDKSNPCECGNGYYQKRKGKSGPFLGCSNYPTCDNTKQIESESKTLCPVCSTGSVVKRQVRQGTNKGKFFYGCSDTDCKYFAWVK